MVRMLYCVRRSLLMLLCAALLAAPARSQVSTYPSGAGATSGTAANGRSVDQNVNRSTDSNFPMLDPNFAHRQMVARREEAKRRMVDSAARLLMLTQDLQTDLQSRAPNEADAKRLDEIAKLARSVRDQMRQ